MFFATVFTVVASSSTASPLANVASATLTTIVQSCTDAVVPGDRQSNLNYANLFALFDNTRTQQAVDAGAETILDFGHAMFVDDDEVETMVETAQGTVGGGSIGFTGRRRTSTPIDTSTIDPNVLHIINLGETIMTKNCHTPNVFPGLLRFYASFELPDHEKEVDYSRSLGAVQQIHQCKLQHMNDNIIQQLAATALVHLKEAAQVVLTPAEMKILEYITIMGKNLNEVYATKSPIVCRALTLWVDFITNDVTVTVANKNALKAANIKHLLQHITLELCWGDEAVLLKVDAACDKFSWPHVDAHLNTNGAHTHEDISEGHGRSVKDSRSTTSHLSSRAAREVLLELLGALSP